MRNIFVYITFLQSTILLLIHYSDSYALTPLNEDEYRIWQVVPPSAFEPSLLDQPELRPSQKKSEYLPYSQQWFMRRFIRSLPQKAPRSDDDSWMPKNRGLQKRALDSIEGKGFNKRGPALDAMEGKDFRKRSLDSIEGREFNKRALDSLDGKGFNKRALDSIEGKGFNKRGPALDSIEGGDFGGLRFKKFLYQLPYDYMY